MNPIREIAKATRATLLLWLLVAVIYPFSMLAIAQLIFPDQANGSLIRNSQGQVIGSALIGQPFQSDRYFNSRPSTTHYSTANPQKDEGGILKTGVSGASNLAPSNPALMDRIKADLPKLRQQANRSPAADLLYTSGSSLDPHITPDAAIAQIQRIAQVRQLQPDQLTTLIQRYTDGRFLGLFGEPGVNVLKLNVALDALR